MKSTLKRQKGLTFISLILLLGLIGFFTLLVLKITPLYLNNSKVASSVKALKEMPDIANKSKQEIKTYLDKNFDINYVDHVTNDDIKIIATPGYVKVNIEYERVEPLFGNLSVLVQFNEGFETGSR